MLDDDAVVPLAERAFGRWALVRPDELWLDVAGIGHQPTRDFLRRVGLPAQGPVFAAAGALSRPPVTFGELADRPGFASRPAGDPLRALVCIGREPNVPVFVDPGTGRVHCPTARGGRPALYTSTVSHLVYFSAYIETHRTLHGRPLDATDQGLDYWEEIYRHLARIDPAACAGGDSYWFDLLLDGYGSGIYEDWAWGPDSVQYFADRGIDPTACEPLRPIAPGAPNPWAQEGSGEDAG